MEPDLFADTTNACLPTTAALSGSLSGPPQGVPLYLGTSSWSSDDWRGTVYPVDAKSSEYLAYYAQRFTAVEIDMTFYRIPTPAMVNGWNQRTPAGFRFAAKIPQVITHEKVLHDCQDELQQFIEVMSLLGDRLGHLADQEGLEIWLTASPLQAGNGVPRLAGNEVALSVGAGYFKLAGLALQSFGNVIGRDGVI